MRQRNTDKTSRSLSYKVSNYGEEFSSGACWESFLEKVGLGLGRVEGGVSENEEAANQCCCQHYEYARLFWAEDEGKFRKAGVL